MTMLPLQFYRSDDIADINVTTILRATSFNWDIMLINAYLAFTSNENDFRIFVTIFVPI